MQGKERLTATNTVAQHSALSTVTEIVESGSHSVQFMVDPDCAQMTAKKPGSRSNVAQFMVDPKYAPMTASRMQGGIGHTVLNMAEGGSALNVKQP